MNLPNLATLITTVEVSIEINKFDMDRYKHPCLSPACIIGHAAALANDGLVPRSHIAMMKTAAQYLDISYVDADEISSGWLGNDPNVEYHVSSKQAIEYLKAIQESEVVIPWADFFGEPRS
jgi:hypothetical protein